MPLDSLLWLRSHLCVHPAVFSDKQLSQLLPHLEACVEAEAAIEDLANKTLRSHTIWFTFQAINLTVPFLGMPRPPLEVDFEFLVSSGFGSEEIRRHLTHAVCASIFAGEMAESSRSDRLLVSRDESENTLFNARTLSDALSACSSASKSSQESLWSKLRSHTLYERFQHHENSTGGMGYPWLKSSEPLQRKLALHVDVAALPHLLGVGDYSPDDDIDECSKELDRLGPSIQWCDEKFAMRLDRMYTLAWPNGSPLLFGHTFLIASDCGPRLRDCDLADGVHLLRACYGEDGQNLLPRLHSSRANECFAKIAEHLRPFAKAPGHLFAYHHLAKFGLIVTERDANHGFPPGISEKWDYRGAVAELMSRREWTLEIEPKIGDEAQQILKMVFTTGLQKELSHKNAKRQRASKKETMTIAACMEDLYDRGRKALILRRVVLGTAALVTPDEVCRRLGYVKYGEANKVGEDSSIDAGKFGSLLHDYELDWNALNKPHLSDRLFRHELDWLNNPETLTQFR